jgi:hypothetical protein
VFAAEIITVRERGTTSAAARLMALSCQTSAVATMLAAVLIVVSKSNSSWD